MVAVKRTVPFDFASTDEATAARDAALTAHAAAEGGEEDEGGDDGDGDLRMRGGGWVVSET